MKEINEHINTVKSYLEESIQGLSKENPKVDFKRKWYDLTVKADISEFLKDTTSIVNTVGLDGYIIIGFDEKEKKFYDSVFSDCKLSDSSFIIDIINKKVDRIFDINIYDEIVDGNKISIIHIPPSINKPHIIRNYEKYSKGVIKNEEQHRIFVRKHTSIYPASRYDIDLMYYDRKNLQPDYELIINAYFDSIKVERGSGLDGINLSINLTIENSGRKPMAICNMSFKIDIPAYKDDYNPVFSLKETYKSSNIVISTNQIWSGQANFESKFIHSPSMDIRPEIINSLNKKTWKMTIYDSNLEVRLVNGKVFNTNINKID